MIFRQPMLTTSETFKMPSLEGDVGYNLPASDDYEIGAGEYAQIHTGIKVQLPPNVWGLILPRSSANRTGKLVVLSGVIDNGYRGELTVMVHNVEPRKWYRFGSQKSILVPKGHSLGQMVLFGVVVHPLELRGELSPSKRGENGYGSTGAAAKLA